MDSPLYSNTPLLRPPLGLRKWSLQWSGLTIELKIFEDKEEINEMGL